MVTQRFISYTNGGLVVCAVDDLLADGKEHVYTQADMSKAARANSFQSLLQIQKEWIQYNNGLVKFLVDTGVLSKDKADEFTRYSDYVPFYRQMDGENTIGPKYFPSNLWC
jgi:hypothetical protein